MSIESRPYQDLYDGFERKAEKVRTLITEGDKEKLAAIEKKYSKMDKHIKWVRNGLYVASVATPLLLYQNVTGSDSRDEGVHFGVCSSLMIPLLATHFHSAQKLDCHIRYKNIIVPKINFLNENKLLQ